MLRSPRDDDVGAFAGGRTASTGVLAVYALNIDVPFAMLNTTGHSDIDIARIRLLLDGVRRVRIIIVP